MKTLVLITGLLAASTVAAQCNQQNLTGRWIGFQNFMAQNATQACVVRVSWLGQVQQGGFCKDSNGVRSQITGGNLTVRTPGCKVYGYIENSFGRMTIEASRMDKTHTTVTGYGFTDFGVTPFTLVKE